MELQSGHHDQLAIMDQRPILSLDELPMCPRCYLTLLLLLATSTVANGAIPVTINFLDTPGEGFFDTTPLSDSDVATANTVGEARRQVVQAAANHLGSFFAPSFSGESWQINAEFNPSDVNESIASAGPFDGANGSTFSGGTSGVWYAASLANHLAGAPVFSGAVVEAEFNSNIDWDYSTAGAPDNELESLFSTSVHEILHGLGFLSDILEDGNYFDGIPAIFDTFLKRGTTPVTSLSRSGRAAALVSDNLFFDAPISKVVNPLGAGPVPIHAPAIFEEGSTGAHLDRESFAAIGDLMLPEASSLVAEPIFMSRLNVAIMADLGYTLASTNLPGDYNGDGTVNAADYTVWRDNFGQPFGTLPNDFVGGTIGAGQYSAWVENYGTSLAPASSVSVPEPASLMLLGLASFAGVSRRRR